MFWGIVMFRVPVRLTTLSLSSPVSQLNVSKTKPRKESNTQVQDKFNVKNNIIYIYIYNT